VAAIPEPRERSREYANHPIAGFTEEKHRSAGRQGGYTVSQFLASAAGEKLAVVLTTDYLRREAAAGRREDFDKYLSAVPGTAPPESDRLD
jgi:hypothetical protein